MPSVSQAQHRFVAAECGRGKEWACEWLHKDKGRVKKLPEKKTESPHMTALKRRSRAKR